MNDEVYAIALITGPMELTEWLWWTGGGWTYDVDAAMLFSSYGAVLREQMRMNVLPQGPIARIPTSPLRDDRACPYRDIYVPLGWFLEQREARRVAMSYSCR